MRTVCSNQSLACAARRGFTLVEMLVAITILVILVTITVTTVNVSMDADRIRSGARQIQSYLEGARDRAIYAKQPRGVRLLLDAYNEDTNLNGVLDTGEDANGNGVLDTPDTTTASSMVFIGPPANIEGELFLSPSGRAVYQNILHDDIEWQFYTARRLLKRGTRIQIPKDTGYWYRVVALHTEDFNNNGNLDAGEDLDLSGVLDTNNLDYQTLVLARPHLDRRGNLKLAFVYDDLEVQVPPQMPTLEDPIPYRMELEPAVLPNQEPVLLPSGIVIDLDFGQYPPAWSAVGSKLDILFSQRGTVTGPVASTGLIHFLLADSQDTLRNLPSTNFDADANGVVDDYETSLGDKRVVTLFTRTGHISTTPVYPNEDVNNNGTLDGGEDLNGNGLLDVQNPFYYAETGEEAP
ncbi:MAG: hypothetical protein CMJ78_15900 [Planctomycetaceae bacterium]|nr:hypothetical protein [Planctomycetaceae bacterium]